MYKPFSKFVLRTPAFPFNQIKSLISNEGKILDFFLKKDIREAIYLASPILYTELDKLINNQIIDNSQKNRIIYSFIRYFYRMSTRCTPFGLFSGCSIGKVSKHNSFVFTENYIRKTRFDMHYLTRFYKKISRSKEVRDEILFLKNSTLYKVFDKYRYLEFQSLYNFETKTLTEIDSSPSLRAIFNNIEKGMKIDQIVDFLTSNGFEEIDAICFVDDLIDSQVIIPCLDDYVCGENFIEKLMELFSDIDRNQDFFYHINESYSLLGKIDNNSNNDSNIALCENIINILKKIDVPFNENYLFQVDLFNPSKKITLEGNIVKEIQSAITFLNRITVSQTNEDLLKFKEKFYERYEFQEIPLCEALDPDIGIGYPPKGQWVEMTSILSDFKLPLIGNQNNSVSSGPFYEILDRKISNCVQNNNSELNIDEEDFKDIPLNWSDTPSTLFCIVELIKTIDNSIEIYLKHCSGVSAANLLTRFSYMNEELYSFVKEITKKEKEFYPDKILAEIIHLPEYRVGNILFRPHIRDCEINYLGSSDLVTNKTLSVSDLVLSIRNNKLFLRSKKLNKEIIPRLTNAHNYQNGLPIYKFLCDMQMQFDRIDFSFNLGKAKYKYYPRIKYRNVILSPMTWIISIEDLSDLFKNDDDIKLQNNIDSWREMNNIPLYTVYLDGDNSLLIDWKFIFSIRSFFSIVKNKKKIILSEYFFNEENLLVQDQKGNSYTNEFIVSFYKEK